MRAAKLILGRGRYFCGQGGLPDEYNKKIQIEEYYKSIMSVIYGHSLLNFSKSTQQGVDLIKIRKKQNVTLIWLFLQYLVPMVTPQFQQLQTRTVGNPRLFCIRSPLTMWTEVTSAKPTSPSERCVFPFLDCRCRALTQNSLKLLHPPGPKLRKKCGNHGN